MTLPPITNCPLPLVQDVMSTSCSQDQMEKKKSKMKQLNSNYMNSETTKKSHAILIDKHIWRCYKRCMHSEDGVTFHISVFLSIPPVESITKRTESHVSALLFYLPFRYLI